MHISCGKLFEQTSFLQAECFIDGVKMLFENAHLLMHTFRPSHVRFCSIFPGFYYLIQRCLSLSSSVPLSHCPHCQMQITTKPALVLFPMSFSEIEEAHRMVAVASSAGLTSGFKRKRAKSAGSDEDYGALYLSDRRTGRWTMEEMTYCDLLMDKFSSGELPVPEGVKLNEFLGNILKSKQSRLTKKMKNAKLSQKKFHRTSGCLADAAEARAVSEAEAAFFSTLTDPQEWAEMKFHISKVWRDQFIRTCACLNQHVDAEAWLASVDEMERRSTAASMALRMAKRKRMLGVALRNDCQNAAQGVFIEYTPSEVRAMNSPAIGAMDRTEQNEVYSSVLATAGNDARNNKTSSALDMLPGKSSLLHSAPFLAKTVMYIERYGIPFEHIDVWVPTFVAADGNNMTEHPKNGDEGKQHCRLCYAGCSTVDKIISADDSKKVRDLTTEERFNFAAFGDYSEKFSFDVGCGLPGRVYDTGNLVRLDRVSQASVSSFERCGGALQWGIQTVVGIPVASPNVGRIVVTLYSSLERTFEESILTRLSEELCRVSYDVDVCCSCTFH